MTRLLLLFLLVAAVPASAQQTSDLVDWRVRADRAQAGAEARVVFDVTIQPGWRLYALGSPVGIPLTVSLDPLPARIRPARLVQTTPREGFDPAFERTYPYFAETGRVVQVLAVGGGVAQGTSTVTGSVRYAVCNDRICLPPTETAFRVPLVVE